MKQQKRNGVASKNKDLTLRGLGSPRQCFKIAKDPSSGQSVLRLTGWE